ncbi:calmodulin-A-like [Dreissena polymorpha]|uniref:calmodulin-A-like n=1 Tax=Dreissena polymorpha TaxID=45954 RepID=UPI002265224C|nr:calmodulin-A-like [Dreissena polymorpha]
MEKSDRETVNLVRQEDTEGAEMSNTDTESGDDNASEEEIDPRYSLTEVQINAIGLNKDTVNGKYHTIGDVFRLLDVDGSGYLDSQELETALKHMGVDITKEEVDELVKKIDQDGNGTVDMFEFSQMVAQKMQVYDPEKELRDAFAVFDKNGDGKVSVEEIREVVESLGGKMTNAEVESMLVDVDENHDGYIDYDEFVHIWMGNEKPESERTTIESQQDECVREVVDGN